MYKYQIKVEYDGSRFVGWQYQKNGLSVQEILQKVFFQVFNQSVTVHGSGRTDSGVHAISQSAHIEIKRKIKNREIFLNSINFYLNKYPVSVIDIKRRKKNFHARFSAVKRTYKYFIINRISPLVFYKNRAWHIKKKLDVKSMRKGAKILKGTHDFSTFRAASCGAKTPIKTLEKVSIKKSKEQIILTFVSRSFLQNQVRSMVGCLKYIGEGKWNSKNLKRAMKLKKRSMCAPPAPPYGLYLTKISYK